MRMRATVQQLLLLQLLLVLMMQMMMTQTESRIAGNHRTGRVHIHAERFVVQRTLAQRFAVLVRDAFAVRNSNGLLTENAMLE